jgi:N-acetylglucosaminyldiphosphoundecaprenol N-acetyl-beta-D-mannosaminyltransferase
MTPSIGDVCNSVEATIDDPVERSSLVWGIPFASLTMQESVDRIEQLLQRRLPSYVITANLNYVMLHHELAEMAAVTRDAALVLADGQPIVWRSRLSSRPLRERVAGSELIFRLAERARDRGWGIYFLGGEPGVAQACASRLALAYPGLRIAGVESPPFRELSDEEQSLQDARIIASGADLLLVAFGQPKGEKWIHRNYRRLKVPVAIQLGASFDFIAGRSKRAPRIWQLVGMEWAYRMSSDPRRLAPRYWANAKFLFKALLKDMRPSSRSLSIAEASRNRSQR